MKEKGQVHIEALVCFCLALVIVTAGVESTNALKKASEKNNEMLLAEAKAQKCSMVADALYSNSGGSVELKENCFSDAMRQTQSIVGSFEKSAFSIAPKISSSQAGSETVLEVEINEHYR